MPKAFIQFELKGTELTLAATEQTINEIITYIGSNPMGVQQIKLLTVTYDQKGTIGRQYDS